MSAGSKEIRGLAREVVGSVRVIAFGTSIVAPAISVVALLVVVVAYAGFASPLVVLITFAGSLCCAFSIAEFARRVPSAGWAYTYNSRGLGPAAGFLTGWMMVYAHALFVPAGVALTSTYASDLIQDAAHVAIGPWLLFPVILAAVAVAAYAGVRTSSSADLLLVAGEMAVIAARAITILVKIGPAHYSAAVFSPASSPNAAPGLPGPTYTCGTCEAATCTCNTNCGQNTCPATCPATCTNTCPNTCANTCKTYCKSGHLQHLYLQLHV
jgi:amino acid transporter